MLVSVDLGTSQTLRSHVCLHPFILLNMSICQYVVCMYIGTYVCTCWRRERDQSCTRSSHYNQFFVRVFMAMFVGGHMVRIDDRLPKTVFYMQLKEGFRLAGGPKICFKDTLKQT